MCGECEIVKLCMLLQHQTSSNMRMDWFTRERNPKLKTRENWARKNLSSFSCKLFDFCVISVPKIKQKNRVRECERAHAVNFRKEMRSRHVVSGSDSEHYSILILNRQFEFGSRSDRMENDSVKDFFSCFGFWEEQECENVHIACVTSL